MQFLQETNPLLFLLALTILYSLFYLFRRNAKDSLLFIGVIACLLLLLSPGGQAIAERTQYMKTPEERISCIAETIIHGGLWDKKASEEFCSL